MLKKEDPDSNQQVKSLLELKSYWQLNIINYKYYIKKNNLSFCNLDVVNNLKKNKTEFVNNKLFI
jgi:hypothetical protein